jgi:hypothetical protein
MVIDHALLNRHATIQNYSGDLGTRSFVLMPPRENWTALLQGKPVPDSPLWPYERLLTADSSRFDSVSLATLEQARLEANLQLHPRAATALASLSPSEQRAVVKATADLQKTIPSAWPSDRVSQLSPDEPEFLLRVASDLRVFVRILDTGQLEMFDIVREDTLRMFLERYGAGSKVG